MLDCGQLTEFEVLNGMTSEQFLRRYTAGGLGDDLAFIRWSGAEAFTPLPRAQVVGRSRFPEIC